MSAFAFELLATDGSARRGRFTTAHGVVETPVFMPVGTRGTVKGLGPDDLRAAGASIVLGNTYHLFLKPGHQLIRELGGLHRFMGWDGPILTDSGGFQVWSLARHRTLTEAGARFRSPIDGRDHELTPELAVEIQHALGADIIHPLDECLAYPATREQTERSLALTMRWAARSLDAHRRAGAPSAMFGIVQGGTDPELRTRAVDETVALGFDGYAIGGLAVGEPKPMMYDLIDCVLPTRNARNGQAFTAEGPVTIKQARYASDPGPLDAACTCYTCRTFSRAYLRHLFMAQELLSHRLLSLHNVHFFAGLMKAMREAVAEGEFEGFRSRFFARYVVSSAEILLDQPPARLEDRLP